MAQKIKITYATFASPDPEVDRLFEEALKKVKTILGGTFTHHINGQSRLEGTPFTNVSPADLQLTMGHFFAASPALVDEAIGAARAAYPAWRDTAWQERVALLRRSADLMSERVFEIGAILSLEVGKNRLEALGDVEETADLIRYCCDAMEQNNGFNKEMLGSATTHNRSVLKPFGVWGVISPFNFPAALSGGPCGAALVAGNTVVHKPAEDAPYTSWLIGQCFVQAGLPNGVFNQLFGGEETGKAIVANRDVDGITFTGSYEVGMSIVGRFALSGRPYLRPFVLEMGGKNPTIVTEKADLEKAALGVMRSAFGLSGQKCSACSRVYVHEAVAEAFTEKLVNLTNEIKVGDPTEAGVYMGPVINQRAYQRYQQAVKELGEAGTILAGGHTLAQNGYYVAPTIVTGLSADNPYWKRELFLPIVKIATYREADEAIRKANEVDFGLTAGLFSEDEAEIAWFMREIEAGVLYINRAAGATTGAWPGYQAFGGWKGSTGTNKAAGSWYYLQQYMREQSQTVVM